MAEGENTLSASLTPTAFRHAYTVEGNVPEANVSISADGSKVFSGTGSFDTDSTYMDSREKELDLHAEAQGYETLDTVVTGNWQGATITYTMQEETTPESHNHVITGEAMDGGYITICDSQADTMLTDTDESNGTYTAEFENDNQSQDVRITQSAPDVNQKSWNGTVTDTLTQDLTDVIVNYDIDFNVPSGSSVETTPRSTGETLTGTSVSYEAGVQTDSADVNVTNPDWQDKDTTLALTYGQNTTQIGLDSLQYEFSGSAGPDGAKVKVFDADTETALDSAQVSGDSYDIDVKRVGTLDSVRMKEEKENHQSLDTIVKDIQTGANTINLPSLDPDTLLYTVHGSAATDSTSYIIVDNANTEDTIGQGMAVNADNPDYKVEYERLATEQDMDSVLISTSRNDYQDKQFKAQVDTGENQVNLPSLDPDTLSYTIQGNAATDSTSYTIVDNANTEDTIATGVAYNDSTPDYEETFKRAATNKADSIDYTLSRDGYADTTITRNINSEGGSTQVDLPQLTEYPEYVVNDEVKGKIRRDEYPYEGDSKAIYNAKVIFEGVNTSYKDTSIMNDDFNYYFYDLKIPTNVQGEADTAEYVRTITPTDTTANKMFQAYKDTVEITEDSYEMEPVYVKELEQNVTLRGTIRDIYDETKTLDSTKVRFKRASDSTLLAEAVTGSDGKYRLPDIECGTEGFFEVGYHDHQASGYLSDVGHTYKIKSDVIKPGEDSTATINYMLVPTELPIPAPDGAPNDGNTVTADPEKIGDIVRKYFIDTEEAMGRQVRLNYGSMSEEDKQTFRDSIIAVGDSLFYGISKSVPMNDPKRPFKLVNEKIDAGQFTNDYHPEQNYHPDSLGWNVSVGGNETFPDAFTGYDNGKQYDETATLGGNIEVDLTDIAGNIKEIYGRSEDRNNVSGYPSFMNIDAAYPTLDDRAIIYLHHKNEKERLGENSKTYYPLDKLEYSISQ